jgi:N-acetylglucosaminyl-diphospho-decaprenol L-rhamnosyltransferase
MTSLPNGCTRHRLERPVLGDFARAVETPVRKTIFIVVPVHNRKALTERFLECLAKQRFRDFTVIVVDDGSTDGTSELIGDRFPEVALLRGDGNLWWSGATNLGIRHALQNASEDDAVLIINDDLEIDPVYLDRLYEVWQSSPNTLIGSVVVDLDDPDRIFCGGERLGRWFAKSRWLNTGKKLSAFGSDYRVKVSLLNGAGTLIPIPVFHKIGLYDEKHFQHGGDTELPVRASNNGYSLIVAYDAVVKIHPETTAGINVQRNYSLRDLKTFFFGIKSYYRLKYRIFFAYDISRNPLAFCSFLVCDLARITFHFVARVRL